MAEERAQELKRKSRSKSVRGKQLLCQVDIVFSAAIPLEEVESDSALHMIVP